MNTKKALLVEDDEAARGLVEIFLRKQGFDVTCVGLVHDGVFEIERCLYHLILVDFNYPDGTGDTIISAAKRQAPNRKVICMSALPQNLHCAQVAGADYVLKKPINREEFNRAVSS
jgi:DNA-binding response OmpR family regulator